MRESWFVALNGFERSSDQLRSMNEFEEFKRSYEVASKLKREVEREREREREERKRFKGTLLAGLDYWVGRVL